MKPMIALAALAAALAACAPTEPVATASPAPDTRFAVTDTTDYDPMTVNTLPAAPPTLKVAYGSASARQYGELRVPQGKGPFPVAVIYHGGCWMGLGGTANSLSLAGGALSSAAGNPATLTHGAVSANASYKVDTTAATVTSGCQKRPSR